MTVSISRYTPGLKNGENVKFNKGETVKYRMRNGEEHTIIIDSDYKRHISGYYGYEAIFDDGQRCFAVDQGIYYWDGKQ